MRTAVDNIAAQARSLIADGMERQIANRIVHNGMLVRAYHFFAWMEGPSGPSDMKLLSAHRQIFDIKQAVKTTSEPHDVRHPQSNQ